MTEERSVSVPVKINYRWVVTKTSVALYVGKVCLGAAHFGSVPRNRQSPGTKYRRYMDAKARLLDQARKYLNDISPDLELGDEVES